MKLVRFYLLNLGGCSLCSQTLLWLRYASRPKCRWDWDWVDLPELADVVMVTGYLTDFNFDLLVGLRDRISKGTFVVSLGDCSTRGGPFGSAGTALGAIERYLTVHLRVEGCGNDAEAVVAVVQRSLQQRSGAIGEDL